MGTVGRGSGVRGLYCCLCCACCRCCGCCCCCRPATAPHVDRRDWDASASTGGDATPRASIELGALALARPMAEIGHPSVELLPPVQERMRDSTSGAASPAASTPGGGSSLDLTASNGTTGTAALPLPRFSAEQPAARTRSSLSLLLWRGRGRGADGGASTPGASVPARESAGPAVPSNSYATDLEEELEDGAADNQCGLLSEAQWLQMLRWLPIRYRVTDPRLVFRASVDGYNLRALRDKCGDLSPLVIIIRTLSVPPKVCFFLPIYSLVLSLILTLYVF